MGVLGETGLSFHLCETLTHGLSGSRVWDPVLTPHFLAGWP